MSSLGKPNLSIGSLGHSTTSTTTITASTITSTSTATTASRIPDDDNDILLEDLHQENYIQLLNIQNVIKICQINVEGLSRNKANYLERFLLEQNCDVLLMQETHTTDINHLARVGNIANFQCIDSINHQYYGIATYVRNSLVMKCEVVTKDVQNDIEVLVIKVDDLYISNIYKPPRANWIQLPVVYPHPAIYLGDFNSHHSLWGYNNDDLNGELVVDWALNNGLHLMFDSKDASTFHSCAWNSNTNPDLCFVSTDCNLNAIPSWRSVGAPFPK